MPDEPTHPTPKKHETFGARKRAIFLENLRSYGSVFFAARQANVNRSHVYDVRKNDPEFAAKWDDAKEDALDLLEASAHKRAHQTSDTLLIFLLKAGRPQQYRDPVQRVAQTDTEGNDRPDTTDAELLAAAARIILRRTSDPAKPGEP